MTLSIRCASLVLLGAGCSHCAAPIVAVAFTAIAGLAAARVADGPGTGLSPSGVFQAANPGARFLRTGHRITTVYGAAFSFGGSAVESAEFFLNQHAGMFNVAAGELVPGSLAADSTHIRPLMPDLETGAMRFTLVSYLQTRDGIPVFRGNIRLLTRNEQRSPLVLVRAGLRDLGDFHPDDTVAVAPNVLGALEAAMQRFPGMVDFTPPEVVIFAGVDDQNLPPRLALVFNGTVGNARTVNYQKQLIVADAATGQVIWTESQIHKVDVAGTVKGMFTPGEKADICETEELAAMPYAQVTIGDTVAYADVDGNFAIPNAGDSDVVVESGVRGRWFRVRNGSDDPEILTQNVAPPGPVTFVHNAPNTDATHRSGVNAYIQANIVRDYTLRYAPTFPTIGGQTEWPVNINVPGECNAFYDGNSINFHPAGGGCPSAAFGDVVHHEYGHHLVRVAGSGQGAYGEGMADVMGVLISDDPIGAYGFNSNCAIGLRTADNNQQYPCTGLIHYCGQLISGCVWSTRNALIATSPSTYMHILSSLAIHSMLLHDGFRIDPSIAVDYLTLDDDNANINDGTPHSSEITAGFGAHNMLPIEGPPPEMSWTALDGGGAWLSGDLLSMSGTVGQPDVGYMSGGAFEMSGGFWSGFEASSICRADFDGDGFVSGLDFDLFVIAFEWGDMEADFDRDGFLTGLDFDQFVSAFEAGC